jgi:hypothetical protein
MNIENGIGEGSGAMPCSAAALRVLKEIAQIVNFLSGDACCEEHETQNWRELQKRLLMFQDDSFSSLKSEPKLMPFQESMNKYYGENLRQ